MTIKAKPLVWRTSPPGGLWEHHAKGVDGAQFLIGMRCHPGRDYKYFPCSCRFKMGEPFAPGASHETIDEAKAACEAHHQAAVQAMVDQWVEEPPTPPKAKGESEKGEYATPPLPPLSPPAPSAG